MIRSIALAIASLALAACIAPAHVVSDIPAMDEPTLITELQSARYGSRNETWHANWEPYRDAIQAELFKRNPQWTEDERRLIAAEQISVGVSTEVVLASWGRPRNINRTTTAGGTAEQWCYGGIYDPRFVYFENGYVTAIQH